LISVVMLNSLA